MSTRLSHPLLRFVMFFILTLAIGLPATALAAPAAQPGDDAELVAYYETDEISMEDSDSAVAYLELYDDQAFELTIDFVSGDENDSTGYGEYEETDDGVVLTILGADDEDFDESIEVELSYDDDDSLVYTGSADGMMGEEDIVFYEADVETADDTDDTGDDTGEETGDDSGEEGSFEIGGVYISPIQANDDSSSVVYLLNLLPDGTASLNSDYLNLEAPVFEIGTWVDNGDNTVSVTITGTPDETYDDEILIDFTVGDYGELVLDELSLYPLSWLSEDTSEEGTTEESDVQIYVAEVQLPDEDAPTNVYMLLYDDGTVLLTDEEQTSTLYGEWTWEDDVLSVSIIGEDEEDFDEPVALAFEAGDDDSLVATEYPVEVFGEDGLTFYPADDDEGSTSGEEFFIYESEQLPSEDTDGIIVSLVLSGDGLALISTDYMNDEEPYLEYGEWTRNEDNIVTVTITEGPDGVYDEPYVFTFEENEDDLSLTLTEESIEVFGDAGLVLNRVE